MIINKKGFTLIELLIVIAIIGLLSTIITVAMGNARLKARDSKRMSDLKQLQTALELYYNDRGFYPAGAGVQLGSGNYACLNNTGFNPSGCTGAFMATIPVDPSNQNYVYDSASSTFTVTAVLEGSVNGLRGTVRLTPSGISE